MYCKNSNEYSTNEIPKTKSTVISVLSPEQEKDFLVRKISMQANGSMPNHTNEIQHQQYVLSGEAKVVVGDEVYHAKQGDFIYIPAGVNHYYETCFGVGYEFLCMITTQQDNIKML
ncbi:MAG: cupin domain-containing protein [Sulfurimonas sp.]|nr:cupin domain-containing protein [Sulfurimonas sp.]MBU1217680.1 cupin domain-containing protein [bacterium]MBU1434292.1 cupin domain-containing protein [bacterium]MBU1503683.1 cupin domain-containing protein [bacterium]MBU3939501.1 cupin domain-containing protein [bacterium]